MQYRRNLLPKAGTFTQLFSKQLTEETFLLFFRLFGYRFTYQLSKHLAKLRLLAESNVTTHFLTVLKEHETRDVGHTQIRRHSVVFIYVHLTNGDFAAELFCELIYNRRNGLTRAAPNGTEIYNNRFALCENTRKCGIGKFFHIVSF